MTRFRTPTGVACAGLVPASANNAARHPTQRFTDPTNEHKSFYITNLNDKRNHVTVMREQTKHILSGALSDPPGIRYVSACHFSLPHLLTRFPLVNQGIQR